MSSVYASLRAGFETVRTGGSIVPLVFFEKGGRKRVEIYDEFSLEESLLIARDSLRNIRGKRYSYVLMYDGYYVENGKRYHAIYAEGAEAGEEHGFKFMQRYIPLPAAEESVTVGNPVYLGTCENLGIC